MPTKRISRQELREDPLATSYHRASEFVMKSWRIVLAGVLVAVTAIVVVVLVSNSRKASEQKAEALWMRAQENLTRGDHATALEIAQTVMDEYPGTKNAKRASLTRGDALLAAGNAAEAGVAYQEAAAALRSDTILYTSARRGQAVALDNQGDYAGAAPIYESLADSAIPEGGRVFDLRSAARCYRLAGDKSRALELLKTLVERYQDHPSRVVSDQVHLARVAIAELEFQP